MASILILFSEPGKGQSGGGEQRQHRHGRVGFERVPEQYDELGLRPRLELHQLELELDERRVLELFSDIPHHSRTSRHGRNPSPSPSASTSFVRSSDTSEAAFNRLVIPAKSLQLKLQPRIGGQNQPRGRDLCSRLERNDGQWCSGS